MRRRLLNPQIPTDGKQHKKKDVAANVPSCMKREVYLLGVQNQEPRGLNTEQREEGRRKKDRKILPSPGDLMEFSWLNFRWALNQCFLFPYIHSVLNSNVQLSNASLTIVCWECCEQIMCFLSFTGLQMVKVVVGHLICTQFLLLR